jgi:hypothetical protein
MMPNSLTNSPPTAMPGTAPVATSIDPSVTAPLLRRIRAEFLEMPGLHLTLRQAARLWHLDLTTCAAALRVLVDDGFLRHGRHGAFQRAKG